MLKIKDNSKLNDIIENYNFEYEADSDYESGYSYAIYMKDGIVIDVSKCFEFDEQGSIITNNNDIEIYGIDNSKLDILYDLIKADMIEKVEDK